MHLLPKLFRAPDTRLAALCAVLAGHNASKPETQIAATLPDPTENLLTTFEGISQAAASLQCETGPVGVSAEYIFACLHPIIVPFQLNTRAAPYPVVIWNRLGGLYQVLDPHVGKRWMTRQAIKSELYQKALIWDEQACWASLQHPSQFDVFELRLNALEISNAKTAELLTMARESIAAWSRLDSALHIVEQMVAKRAQHGKEAEKLLDLFVNQDDVTAWPRSEPEIVTPSAKEGAVSFRGVVAVPIIACEPTTETVEDSPHPDEATASPPTPQPTPPSTLGVIRQVLLEEGALHPAVLLVTILVAAGGVFFEAIILRGLMEIGLALDTTGKRATMIVLAMLFLGMLFLLSWGLKRSSTQLGRRIDLRLRQAAFSVVPNLSDQYFQRLSTADIVDRIHNLQSVSMLTPSMTSFLTRMLRVIAITIGMAWLDWQVAGIAILLTWLGTIYYIGILPSLYQYTYQTASVNGWLSILYVDAVRGRPSIWSHGAEQSMRYEYDGGLTQYGQAVLTRQWYLLLVMAGSLAFGTFGPILQLLNFTARGGSAANLLLLFYWAMEFSQIFSEALVELQMSTEYLANANRFGEILQAKPESARLPSSNGQDRPADETHPTPYIQMQDVVVRLGEQTILEKISLEIEKGEHIAIVGTSGAGKSTLVSLLLGRHYAAEGDIYVDGTQLDYPQLQQLRQRTAWVDPNMQLWDETLLHNLVYGSTDKDVRERLQTTLEQADLLTLLSRMPEGLLSPMGEAGRRVSGGEGQRVRFARGLQQHSAELVILDEAFRGIDREKRSTLLERARTHWANTTLLCVTHDVSHTLSFERVLVLDQGKIVEDASPQELMNRPDSRFRTLYDEEEMVRIKLWQNDTWRHLYLENGVLTETETLQAS